MTVMKWGDPTVDPILWRTFHEFVGNDTVINSLNYREVNIVDYVNGVLYDTILVGHFRVDSLKVFFRAKDQINPISNYLYADTGEILLYNYNLQISDTFYFNQNVQPNHFLVLNSIDSVNFNGNYYKKYNLTPHGYQSHSYNYHWIEGMGSIEGFFPAHSMFESALYYRCFHSMGESFLFSFMGANDCYSIPLNLEELQKTEKTLVKILDLTGRETTFQPNTLQIYVYSNGAREKVFRME